MIQSTMQGGNLSLATLVEYSRKSFPEGRVRTWTGSAFRDISFAEIGEQAAQLAHALDGLGVGRGDRVATFMWNNNEHQVVYAAVPSMGPCCIPSTCGSRPSRRCSSSTTPTTKVILVDASVAPMLSAYVAQAPGCGT